MYCREKEVVFLYSKENISKKTKTLVFCALLCALSVAVGWFCKLYLTFGAVRITFENAPIILAGMFFGPLAGGTVGAVSDLISCVLAGNAVNPIITVGSVSVGALSGLIFLWLKKKKSYPVFLICCLCAHAVGSMLLKSVGLYTYGYAIPVLLLRIPLYIAISAAESYIIYIIAKNRDISSRLERL